ncbi:MAG: phage tail protein [Chitinophagales bacterium]
MSEPYVGEIRMVGFNFAPRGWAFCDGQLLAVSQNDALFSLLGTIYGGDGRTTFGLPDLRGRIPIHQGTGPGLTNRRLGSKGGAETETLIVNQLPSHSHTVRANSNSGTKDTPSGNFLAAFATNDNEYSTYTDGTMKPNIINTGGSQSHTNLMPTLCIHFCIATTGIYPSRS